MKITDNPEKRTVDVTILLNIWKRDYLDEQLAAILAQTVYPKEIWIINYESHVSIEGIVAKYKTLFPGINLIKSDKNLKYYGRFSLAINLDTEFVWIIDDDVMPGIQWLENCTEKCHSLNSIISCSGRIIPERDFYPEYPGNKSDFSHFIGDMNEDLKRGFCLEDTVVDYACQSYFFKTEWLSAFWSIWPVTFMSGEDMHLSATCKCLLNVNTVVLKQETVLDTGSSNLQYGMDDYASWKRTDFLTERAKVLRYHILEKGWTPLLWKKQYKTDFG